MANHYSIAPQITLSECVDRYFLARRVQGKKYYASYLADAQRIWKDIFQKTLFVMASKWERVHKGTPYDYFYLPQCAVRVFGIFVTDECNNLVQLFYNEQKNVIPVPEVEVADPICNTCGGGDLCSAVNTTTFTTKVIFTINGVDYIEKKWITYCKDGCVIEYTETPVKQYNDIVGEGGDFNEDYNNDYLIGSTGFANFEVVYEKSQKLLCQLKTKPCGCPEESSENDDLLTKTCGCYIGCRKKKCYPVTNNVNNNHFGEVKVSDCGTKMFLINCKNKPDFVNISYQVSGDNPTAEVMVPDYAIDCIHYGMDYYSIRFNRSIPVYERELARQRYIDADMNLLRYLYPISLSFLEKVQDEKILW